MKVPQIEYNPLRVLGVFANATLREIEQNKAQLRAYVRVGQEVQLPLWLNGLSLLPKLPVITNEHLAQAEADLSLQDERINYARFWLERDSDHAQEDLEACALLNDNRVNEARQLWGHRTDHAAQKNLLLLDVMEDNWSELATHATNCFKNDISEFRLFMSEAVKSSAAANGELSHQLLVHFTEEPLKAEMKRVLENLHKQALDETINLIRTDPKDLPQLKRVIDEALGEMCHVDALKNLLGSESVVYIYYANETAKNLCKLICHYGSPYKLSGYTSWAYQQVNELWGYLNENDPEYKELSVLRSKLQPAAITYANNSDGSHSCLTNFVATFALIWIFAFLGRTCDHSGRPDHHNELKQIEFDSKWLQQYHDRTAADDSLIKWSEQYEERKQRLEEAITEEINRLEQEGSKLKTKPTEAASLPPPEEIKHPEIDAATAHKMDSLMRQHQPKREPDSLTID